MFSRELNKCSFFKAWGLQWFQAAVCWVLSPILQSPENWYFVSVLIVEKEAPFWCIYIYISLCNKADEYYQKFSSNFTLKLLLDHTKIYLRILL